MFYLKAEVGAWDYVDGAFVARTPLEVTQTMRDATHLGSTFDKARFVQYTDATFSRRVTRRPQDEVCHQIVFFSFFFSFFFSCSPTEFPHSTWACLAR